ncbi:putative F-box protein At3g52320 [Lotus japonicus]|uniref:putative F-box protein At3g52320 n=1 Tax=Lotus japonicus TaxID=34305 RepID=UPI00259094F4|nr:putative F-box protein At3g52320 [Lotus japonicus]
MEGTYGVMEVKWWSDDGVMKVVVEERDDGVMKNGTRSSKVQPFLFACPSPNDLQVLNVFLGHLSIPIHKEVQDHIEEQPVSFPTAPTIHVGNLTTQRIVTLPQDNTLEFGPEVSIFTHFGYDPLHDTFKVLNFINDASLSEGSYELRILTIGEYVWKVIFPDDFTLNLHRLESKGLCVNGAIHWVDLDNEVLITFNVGQEQFRKIPITGEQDSQEEDMISYELLELGGHLSLVKFMKKGHIELSILKDYKNQV